MSDLGLHSVVIETDAEEHVESNLDWGEGGSVYV
jgi:hypothetical protein